MILGRVLVPPSLLSPESNVARKWISEPIILYFSYYSILFLFCFSALFVIASLLYRIVRNKVQIDCDLF